MEKFLYPVTPMREGGRAKSKCMMRRSLKKRRGKATDLKLEELRERERKGEAPKGSRDIEIDVGG